MEILLIIAIGVLALLFMVAKPHIATLVVVFLLYTNIPVIAKNFLHIPEFVAGSFVLLLFIPLTVYLFIRREKLIVDHVLALMLIFLAIVFLSSLFAKDLTIAFQWIVTFVVEGLALYFLIINVVRDTKVLKQVMWVLVFSCSLLGGLSLYQDVTRSYDNTYFGLAQRKIEKEEGSAVGESSFDRTEVGGTDRAGGPFGESDRYAQIMIVVLPLALFLFLGEKYKLPRTLAAMAALLIVSGILLSFSRGAFITLVLLLFILIALRYVRPSQVIGISAVLLLLMVFAAPGYLSRIETLGSVGGLFSEDPYQTEAVIRGRTTEMLAALLAFIDHPLLGVGPGQYTPFYSADYQSDSDIAFRGLNRPRRAHTLYFELAAELGMLGFSVFMVMVLYTMYRLWLLRHLVGISRPDIYNTTTAFLLSITAYLGSAVFLHLSYQRYYWLILALAGAAIQIFKAELEATR